MRKRSGLVGFSWSLTLILAGNGLASAQVGGSDWPPAYWSEPTGPAAYPPQRGYPPAGYPAAAYPTMGMPSLSPVPAAGYIIPPPAPPQPIFQAPSAPQLMIVPPMFNPYAGAMPIMNYEALAPGKEVRPARFVRPQRTHLPPCPECVAPEASRPSIKPEVEEEIIDPGLAKLTAVPPDLDDCGKGPGWIPEPPQLYAPNMIGDPTGGAPGAIRTSGLYRSLIEHPAIGGERLNIAENNSPLPRDRVYFRYNHLQNTNDVGFFDIDHDYNLDRFTFGGEKTFFASRMSIEVRIPFARQIASDLDVVNSGTEFGLPLFDYATQFGNVGVIPKFLVFQTPALAVSTGLGINLPTAPDVRVRVLLDNDNFPIAGGGVRDVLAHFQGTVKNGTVNLTPFIATLYTPGPRFFAQSFVQLDVPANKSEARIDSAVSPSGSLFDFRDLPRLAGEIEQQALLRADLGIGYWIYRANPTKRITGIAPTVEVHYLTALEDATTFDALILGGLTPAEQIRLTAGNLSNHFDIVNLTVGSTVEFWNRSTLAAGFYIPLRQDVSERPFDFGFTLQLNYRFGYQMVASAF